MEAESTQTTETYLKLLGWLHTNQKKVMIGGGVAAVIALIVGFMAWQKNQAQSDANAQLMALPLASIRDGRLVTPPASSFLDLTKQYPDTSAGEYAELLGAESYFTDGKYPEAYQEFTKFIGDYPTSALLSQAKVGQAASLEGEGKIQDAALKYQEVISTYSSDANITSPVKLTLARLDEELNKPDQALTYYSDLARINNPYDPWAAEARERGSLLLVKHPELRKAPPSATGSPSAASPASGLRLPPSSQPAKAPAPAPAKP